MSFLRLARPGRPGPAAARLPGRRWQVRQGSNPQPAVLETAALPIELLTCRPVMAVRLFGFLVGRVLPARGAELARLELLRLRFLIPRRGIVPPLAFAALERDDLSHVQPFLPSDALFVVSTLSPRTRSPRTDDRLREKAQDQN